MTSVAEYNNNPGNIRPPKGLTYDGQIGIDDRGFAIFATKEAGRGALMQDIRAKQKQGLNNPNSFIDKYAPASGENPEEARDNYKIRMAQHLGLKSTTDPFPEGSEEKIADLIASFEAGTPAVAAETKPSASNPFAGRTPKARTDSGEVLPPLVADETNTEKVMGAVGKAGEYIATKALENPEIPAAAGVGLGKGVLEKILQNPEKNLVGEGEKTLQQVQAAQDAAKAAQTRVNEIQRVTSGREPVDLESLQREFESSRTSNRIMEDELRAAQSDLRAMPRTYVPPVEPAIAETAEQILARTTPGAAGAQKWVEAMSDDVPTLLAQKARNMRGDNPKGGQAIIDAQSAAVQRLEGMGLGDFKLDPTKTLSLPTAETTRLEQELAAKQAQEAAEQAARAQEVETRRLAAEADLARQRQLATQRVEDARTTKRLTGEQAADAKRAANTANQRAASQAKSDAGKLETARVSASTAKQIARDAEAAQPGALTMMGREAGRRFAEKAPIIGNVLGAVGATISTSEAVDRYKKGDYSGSVLGAIEAALNAASMAPPTSPAGLLTKGVGTVGSLGMIPVWIAHDYFGNKGPWAPKKEPQKARGGLTSMR
jgi:hypothetical protein